MTTTIRSVLVWTLLLLPAAAAADSAVHETIKGTTLNFTFDSSPIGNLVYQLDTMSALARTPSAERFLAAWKKLGWSAEDDAALVRWREVRTPYANTVVAIPTPESDALGFPFESRDVELDKKLRLAGYTAATLDEYRAHLGLLLAPADATALVTVASRFLPRMERAWNEHLRASVAHILEQRVAPVRDKQLLPLVEQFAAFYRTELPPDTVLHFHMMALPPGKGATHAEAMEDHAVEEVSDANIADDLSVTLHELAHFFYHASTLLPFSAFAHSSRADALAAHNLFDEGVATALQAIVRKRLLTPKEVEARWATRGGFYNEPFIDAAGRALLPLCERALADGQRLDDAFVAAYFVALADKLSDRLESPVPLLRTMYAAGEDTVSQPAMDELMAKVHPSNSFTVGIDDAAQARWRAMPKLSGVVLVTTAHLASLRAWAPLLGKVSVEQIARAAPRVRGLVYGIARSPQASIFVIVGRDGAALEQAVDRFVALPRGRAGQLVTLR